MKFFRSKIDDNQVEDLKDQILNGRIIDWSPISNKNAGIKFEDLKYILTYYNINNYITFRIKYFD